LALDILGVALLKSPLLKSLAQLKSAAFVSRNPAPGGGREHS